MYQYFNQASQQVHPPRFPTVLCAVSLAVTPNTSIFIAYHVSSSRYCSIFVPQEGWQVATKRYLQVSTALLLSSNLPTQPKDYIQLTLSVILNGYKLTPQRTHRANCSYVVLKYKPNKQKQTNLAVHH
jgi:hypothetical protein